MRRDKELIKALLLYKEEYREGGNKIIEPTDLPERFHSISICDFREHGQLIFDKGLAVGMLVERGIIISRLTWEGYDFLDNARISSVWQTAKKVAGEMSWDIFVSILKQVAADYAEAGLNQLIGS